MKQNITANKEKTDKPKRKAPPHAFKPGQSGNPNGRPKLTAEERDLVAACRDKSNAALDVMERIMHDGENERNRLAAALAIIERGYGKPVQPIEANVTTHEAALDDLA